MINLPFQFALPHQITPLSCTSVALTTYLKRIKSLIKLFRLSPRSISSDKDIFNSIGAWSTVKPFSLWPFTNASALTVKGVNSFLEGNWSVDTRLYVEITKHVVNSVLESLLVLATFSSWLSTLVPVNNSWMCKVASSMNKYQTDMVIKCYKDTLWKHVETSKKVPLDFSYFMHWLRYLYSELHCFSFVNSPCF